MKPLVALGLIIIAIGLFLAIGPMFLPRSMFGEAGHGDGMGLIGMMMLGGLLTVGGMILAVIGSILAGRKTENPDTKADAQ